jgi:hypothetical protein
LGASKVASVAGLSARLPQPTSQPFRPERVRVSARAALLGRGELPIRRSVIGVAVLDYAHGRPFTIWRFYLPGCSGECETDTQGHHASRIPSRLAPYPRNASRFDGRPSSRARRAPAAGSRQSPLSAGSAARPAEIRPCQAGAAEAPTRTLPAVKARHGADTRSRATKTVKCTKSKSPFGNLSTIGKR